MEEPNEKFSTYGVICTPLDPTKQRRVSYAGTLERALRNILPHLEASR